MYAFEYDPATKIVFIHANGYWPRDGSVPERWATSVSTTYRLTRGTWCGLTFKELKAAGSGMLVIGEDGTASIRCHSAPGMS